MLTNEELEANKELGESDTPEKIEKAKERLYKAQNRVAKAKEVYTNRNMI